MTNSESDEIEGNTLNVYAFVVKEGKPVGPREVMRGANLSSCKYGISAIAKARISRVNSKECLRFVCGKAENKCKWPSVDW